MTSTTQTKTLSPVEEAAKAIKWESFYTERFEGRDDAEVLTWTERCGKCGGSGYIAHYAGIDGGICYDCEGIQSTRTVRSTVGDERAKDKATAQRRAGEARKNLRTQAKAVAAEQDRLASRIGRYPVMHLFTWEGQKTLPLTEWAEEKLSDLRFKDAKWGLSEKQVEFAARLLDEGVARQMSAPVAAAKKAEEEAAKVPAPEGRITVVGTVVKAKMAFNDFGSVTKLIVETEGGWTLFVNAPADLKDAGYELETAEVESGEREDVRRFEDEETWTTGFWMVGRKVQMNVTVKQSDRDVAQGFGSRPAKAVIL